HLWTSNSVSFRLDSGFGAASHFPGSRGKPGRFRTFPGTYGTKCRRRSLMNWKGVLPAITTCFTESLRVDHDFMAEHCRWLLDNGCSGIVALGSLGEGSSLTFDEKLEVLRTCVTAVRGRGPVVASISALTTSEAVALAKAAAGQGCDGLMVLPPYVYKGD